MDLSCPRCGGAMERGFIIDVTCGGVAPPEWAEGEPEVSFWTGVKLKGRVRHPVRTYRYEGCGYLESYAPLSPE